MDPHGNNTSGVSAEQSANKTNENVANCYGTHAPPSTNSDTNDEKAGSIGTDSAAKNPKSSQSRVVDPLRVIRKILNDRYEVTNFLGSGSFGYVYRGRDLRFDRGDETALVAIKFMKSSTINKSGFEREAQLMKRFQHHHFVEVYDYGDNVDGLSWLVMEYLPGRTLDVILEEVAGPADRSLIIQFGEQVLGALNSAHRKSLIHRDLKPANIMVMPDGDEGALCFKVMDFGTSSQMDAKGTLANHTMNGAGTPTFMAPEQIANAEGTPQSDLYSVGVMLYWMLSGQLPFEVCSLPKTLYDTLHTAPPPLSSVAPRGTVPRSLDLLIAQCLAKKPEERPKDLLDVRDRLLNALRKTDRPKPVRRPSRLIAGLCIAAVIAAPACLWIFHGREAAKPNDFIASMERQTTPVRLQTLVDHPIPIALNSETSGASDIGESDSTALQTEFAASVSVAGSAPPDSENAGPAAGQENQPDTGSLVSSLPPNGSSPEQSSRDPNPSPSKVNTANGSSTLIETTTTVETTLVVAIPLPAYLPIAMLTSGPAIASSQIVLPGIPSIDMELPAPLDLPVLLDAPWPVTMSLEDWLIRRSKSSIANGTGAKGKPVDADTRPTTVEPSHDPNEANQLCSEGIELFSKGEIDKAAAKFEAAIQINSQLVAAFIWRGRVRQARNELKEAIGDYTEAIFRDWTNASAYSNRGSAYWQLGKFDFALRDLDHAIGIDSKFADAYNNRGIVHCSRHELLQAIADFDVAIHLEKDNAKAYFNRGNARRERDDVDKALTDYNKAIELDPHLVAAYISRGVLYLSKRDFDRAFADQSQAIRLDPANAEAFHRRGNVSSAKRDYQKAIDDYDQAIQHAPNFVIAFINRGIAKHELGHKSNAIDDFKEALRLDPTNEMAKTELTNAQRTPK